MAARLRLAPLEPRDTPAGFFDLAYGTNGVAPLALPGAATAAVAALVALPDGSAVAAVYDPQAADARDFGVVKLTPAGQPDPAFGHNGLAVVGFDLAGPGLGADTPTALAVTPDGGVVVVGTAATGPTSPSAEPATRVAVARLTAAGVPDPTFDGDGRLTLSLTPSGTGADAPLAVGVRPDGSLVIVGRARPDPALAASTAVAVRLEPSGNRDPAYGTPALGTDVDTAAVDPAGRVLASHRTTTFFGKAVEHALAVTRLRADGRPDAGYGGDGSAEAGTYTTTVGLTVGLAVDLLPQADGGVLVSFDTAYGTPDFPASTVTRLDPAGVPDPAFAGDGRLTELVGPSVRVDAAGRLLGFPTAGTADPLAAVLRLTPAGARDDTFGTGGVVSLGDVGGTQPAGLALRTDGTALVAASYPAPAGGPAGRVAGVARLLPVADQPPTISGVPAAVTTRQGEPARLSFTVDDPDGSVGDLTGPAGNLAVTATSDGPLIPAGGLAVGGTGATRTLTVTPAPGRSGTQTVTLTVRDATGATATATVAVTVTPFPARLGGTVRYAVGPAAGGGPTVGVFNSDGTLIRTLGVLSAGFAGGVRVAAADLTGDGVPDLVVGGGPGAAARVEVYDGATFARLVALDPFEPGFTGGVNVAAGDLTGDGRAEVVVTPDEGGGPRVKVYDGAGFALVQDFFGIEDVNFRGGARTAVGDLNGDGVGDLLVAAGVGGGPRVAGFDGATLRPGAAPARLFADLFVFEPSLRNGVYLAAGDLDGDGAADLVAGGGPGGGPRVFALGGKQLVAGKQAVLADFFAGDPADRTGVRVAAKDVDGDSRADLVTAAGRRVGGYLATALGGPPAFAADPLADSPPGVVVG